MADTSDFRRYDVGGTVRIECYTNNEIMPINDAIKMVIIFKRKSGTIIQRDATFTTDGTDGLMEYTFQEGDIDSDGKWVMQGFVRFSASKQFYGDLIDIEIGKVLEEVA